MSTPVFQETRKEIHREVRKSIRKEINEGKTPFLLLTNLTYHFCIQ